jgi:hypothetical protein
MRFFIALVVFAVGVALYAVAALLVDRRRLLRARRVARRARATGGQVATAQIADAMPLYLWIVACLVVGTALMLGSCAGVILW